MGNFAKIICSDITAHASKRNPHRFLESHFSLRKRSPHMLPSEIPAVFSNFPNLAPQSVSLYNIHQNSRRTIKIHTPRINNRIPYTNRVCRESPSQILHHPRKYISHKIIANYSPPLIHVSSSFGAPIFCPTELFFQYRSHSMEIWNS